MMNRHSCCLKNDIAMFPGLFTLCLNVKDLPAMRRFYEALGMKVHIDQPTSVLLNNGDFDLALMTFLNEPPSISGVLILSKCTRQ